MPFFRAPRPSFAATMALVALIACEREPGGPSLVPTASIQVLPTFLNAEAASRIPISTVAFEIRIPGGRVVSDTTIAYPAGADSLVVSIEVPMLTTSLEGGQTFSMRLAMLGPTGDTLFKGGPINVTAHAAGGGGTPAAAVVVPLRYTGRGANAASVRLIGRDTVLSFGDSLLVGAEVLDSAGAVITGVPVIFETPDTTLLRIPNDEVGRIYARTVRGPARVAVRTLTGQGALRRIIVQPVATKLTIVSGSGQTGVVNESVAPAVVKVTAADDLGVAGVPVRFTVVSGGGAVLDTTVLTDTTGTTGARWKLGTVAGTNSVSAEVTGLTGSPALFSATAQHGVPSRAVFTTQPTTVIAGVPMPAGVNVAVQDAFGNLATQYADTIALRIVTNPGGSALAGSTVQVASGGVASFAGVKLNRSGSGYRLGATARGVGTSATSELFNVGAATPAVVVKRSGDAQIGSPSAVLPETLSVFVKDSLGNHLPGVTVTWTITTGSGTVSTATSVTNDDGVAKVRWTLGGGIGVNSVDASVAGVSSAPRFGAVAVPPGTTRVWTGKSGTNWNTAANWFPAGVPLASDTLFIAAGLGLPALSANGDAGSIVAQPGATINLGAFTLTAGGKVDVGTIAGTGEVVLAGTSRTVMGAFPNLRVTGTYSLAGHTSVTGNVIVAGTGRLTLGGRRLSVGGRFETMESGTLEMIDAADSLITEGDLKFGGGSHTGRLTNGYLQLKGAFAQTGTSDAFVASGNHRTRFAGTASQTATFADGRASKFRELEVSNPTGLSFGGRATIGGRMNILGGAGNVTGPDTVGVGGDLLDATGGRWQIGITKFEGITNSLPVSLTTKAVVTGTLAPAAGGTINGDVDVRGGIFNIGGLGVPLAATVTGNVDVRAGSLQVFANATFNVSGAFSTNETGVLKMQDGSGQMNVAGSATFSGGSTTGQLDNGTLRIAGNFTQTGTRAMFEASGSHKTIFNGTAAQTLTFPDADSTDSGIFNDVQFDNAAGTTLAGGVYSRRDVTVGAGAGNVTGGTMSVGGNLNTTPEQWQPGSTVLTGINPTIPSRFDTPLTVTGTLTLAGNLTVNSTLDIAGTGTISPNGKVLKATGQLGTHESGKLTMAAGDSVDVGQVYFAGGSTVGAMTGGMLVVRGDVRALTTSDGAGSPAPFSPSGTHRTVLMGTGKKLYLRNASATGNHFNKVEVATTGSLLLEDKIFVATDSLIVKAGAELGSHSAGERVVATGKVHVNGGTLHPQALEVSDGIANTGGLYHPDTTAFVGTGRTLPATLTYSHVRVSTTTGTMWISENATVNGQLHLSGAGADLRVGDGTGFDNVTVTGRLLVENGAKLTMQNTTGILAVTGEAIFRGAEPALTDGSLRVAGNFTQQATSTNNSYVASGNHEFQFVGTGVQAVSFQTPGPSASRFRNVININSVTLNSDVEISGTYTQSAGKTLQRGGPTLGRLMVSGTATISSSGVVNPYMVIAGNEFFSSSTVTADTTVFVGAARAVNPPTAWGGSSTVRFSLSGAATVAGINTLPRVIVNGVGSVLAVGTSGNITVTGDLRTEAGGALQMAIAGTSMTVTGNATFAGGSTAGLLTNGSLIARGNLTQAGGDVAAFSASGAHTTILRPSAANRQVILSTPDSLVASHFNNLQLDNSLGAGTVSTQLASNVVAVGQVKTIAHTAGGFRRTVNGGGFTMVVGGVDADSLTLDNTRLVVASNKAWTRLNTVTWSNMPSTAVQLAVIRDGDGASYPLNGMVFNPPSGSPTAPGFTGLGAYLRVQRASGAGGFNVPLTSTTPFNHAGGAVSDSPGVATFSGWSF